MTLQTNMKINGTKFGTQGIHGTGRARGGKSALLLAGVLAMGLGGFVTAPAVWAKPPTEVKDNGQEERTVRIDDLPKAARKSFERERGSNTLSDIKVVQQPGGEVFYRAYIEERGKQRWIRVTADGVVKGETDAREIREPAPAPAREVARPAANRPEVVTFDDLPGHAKEAIGREAGALIRRGDVYKSVTRAGLPIYSCEVGDGNRTRMITVDATGKLYSDVDDTRPGEKGVDFEALPYGPKTSLGREVADGKVAKVIQGTDKGGHTYYSALVRDKSGPYWVTVDDGGHIIAEHDVK